VYLGVAALLAFHYNVMHQVGDFMLTKDFNFASALQSVLNVNTAATLLPREMSGSGYKHQTAPAASGTPHKGKGDQGQSSGNQGDKVGKLERQVAHWKKTAEEARSRKRDEPRRRSGGGGKSGGRRYERSRSVRAITTPAETGAARWVGG
jgi:hypothetical protein